MCNSKKSAAKVQLLKELKELKELKGVKGVFLLMQKAYICIILTIIL